MDQNLKSISDFIQQNENLTAEEKASLTKAVADANKELEITAFKLDRTEKVKRTTAILLEETIEELEHKRKAVEAQNRELEIESALERVRSVAMGMKNPAEMVDVCKIISEQLEFLKVKDIRNVQTAVIYESKGTYINYEYYARHNKLLTTEVSYKTHHLQEQFANQMLKGAGEFFSPSLEGQQVKDWYEYQKTTNQFADSFLEDAQTLNYYMFSLGPVALGISTYSPLKEEEINLFKRFRNVFELAYRRFTDIQKAEAQAREAQIEAAVERVRAKSMGMYQTSDLYKVNEEVLSQLYKLKVDGLTGVSIYLVDENDIVTVWDLSSPGNMSIPNSYSIKYDAKKYPILGEWVENWKSSNQDYFVFDFSKEKLLKAIEEFKEIHPKMANNFKNAIESGKLKHQWSPAGRLSDGLLSIDLINPPSEDTKSIVLKMAGAFNMAYQRFLDLQKAEAQAREAQIEASLEKVRSSAMAMHNSNDISVTTSVIFTELHKLGIESLRCGIGLLSKKSNVAEVYAATTSSDGEFHTINTTRDMTEHPSLIQQYESWLKQESLVTVLSGEELKSYYQHVFFKSAPSRVPPENSDRKEHGYYIPFSEGLFYSWTERPYSENEVSILNRFKTIIDLTFRRFLDLQKAEAQAREAQIEASLERLRSKTMAMHNSQDVGESVATMFDELERLEVKTKRCGVLIHGNPVNTEVWTARLNPAGKAALIIGHLDMTVHPLLSGARNSWLNKESSFSYELTGEDIKNYFRAINDTKTYPHHFNIDALPSTEYHSDFHFRDGSIFAFTAEPIPSEDAIIFKRFAGVFGQTYRRYLDLQKAEEQAREAKIEAALERVRAQAMAMHHSEDLGKTIEVYYEQLDNLIDSTIVRCGAGLLNKENTIAEMSTASKSPEGKTYHVTGTIDMQGHPLLDKTYEHWLKQKEYHHVLHGNEIKEYYQYITNQVAIPENTGDDELYFYFPMFTEGSFYVVTNNEVPEDELQIFRRFSSVLSLTYRRFNDLLKAEAQTREAQIEAALERVRASTMAMHKSEQLAETAKVLFEQFDLLGKIPDRISIGIIKEEKQLFEWWVTNQNGSQLNYGFNASIAEPSMAKMFTAWKEKKDSIVIDLTGKDLQDWIRFVREEVKMEIDEANMKGRRVHQGAFFSQGVLLFSTHEPVANDVMHLLVRFAKVFNQTYTRFLDLQKAEMQAKEAIKASSLDRVRGEIASMRTINDLQRITPIIWHELIALGVPFVRCGVFIIDDSTEHIQVHLSSPDGSSLGALDLPFNSSELTINSVNHWRQVIIFKTHWDKQEFLNFMQSMVREGQVQNTETYQGASKPPESLDLHFIPFKQGMLYVGNSSPLEIDELQLVKSLAESFSIAYARYEDFRQLEEAKNQIEKTFTELKAAQSQLIQSEKMASLGELTAGIAHEIQNPLNFVNNFSEVSTELVDEMKDELAAGNWQLATEIASDLRQNLEKINHHGKRAADIVKGMLQHSRNNSGTKEPSNINTLADEYLRLAYHGLRAKDKSFNATMVTDFDESIGKIDIIPQDIGRVILNLITNAFYAVQMRVETQHAASLQYEPTVTVSTAFLNPPSGGRGAFVSISVRDNGSGIPAHIVDKIFQPFFTTKPTGQGTGLGLSLAYDIVKAHGGELKVETKEGEGTEFIIQLPNA